MLVMAVLKHDVLMLLIFKKYKKHLPEGLKWKKLTSLVMIEMIREGADFRTTDMRFYISSCLPTISCSTFRR